jgi:protein-disulfide isomerase
MPMFRLAQRGLAAVVMILAAAAIPAAAQQQSEPADVPESLSGPFDANETKAIQGIIRNYLLENPEVIVEAVEILRERQRQAEAQQREGAIKAHKAALTDPGPLPVLGNPDGDVTIVEFFDYRCPYCRSVADDLFETVEADGNVRLVMKEYPILGEESVAAARVAIATAAQGKYAEFHHKLITEVRNVSRESALKLAESMGLDMDKLKADMNDTWVDEELRRTFSLAQALSVSGTPAFIVGGTMAPGAIPAARLRQMIAQTREQQG